MEIKDEELCVLLERLAATDAMFRTPVSTIRDVAELTELSPTAIAEILAEIRGTTLLAELKKEVHLHSRRINAVEEKLQLTTSNSEKQDPSERFIKLLRAEENERAFNLKLVLAICMIILATCVIIYLQFRR